MMLKERMDAIVQRVARRTDVHPNHFFGRSRRAHYAQARQLAMVLCYTFTDASIADVARFFQRTRATVYYATGEVGRRRQLDPHGHIAQTWQAIKEELHRMASTEPISGDTLEQLRQLHRRRHMDMSKQVSANRMHPGDVSYQSRCLSALLRLAEHDVRGALVDLEDPLMNEFSAPELGRFVDQEVSRMRTEGWPAPEVEALAACRTLLHALPRTDDDEPTRQPQEPEDGQHVE